MKSQDTNILAKFIIVLGALVMLTVVVFLIAQFSSSPRPDSNKGLEKDEFARMQLAKINERIAPVGRVVAGPVTADAVPASEGAAKDNVVSSAGKGEEIYQAACVTCHGTGLMDAPKLGDAADWSSRFAQGFDVVLNNAKNGKGSMPPRGGSADLSDADLKSVVVYMLKESGQTVAVEDSGDGKQNETEIAAASVSTQESVATEVSGSNKGEEIYQAACVTCHGTGLMDAPKLGDAADWGSRFAQGFDVVLNNATNGKGSMPPRGGSADLSDADLKSVVVYMLRESGQTVAVEDSGADKKDEQAVVAAPEATKEPAAAEGSGSNKGEEIYQAACVACHGTGLMDAPKLGDAADWDSRFAQGFDVVLNNAANGKGSMPPRGGNAGLSDADLKSVVIYMLSESGQTVADGDMGSGNEKTEIAAVQESDSAVDDKTPEDEVVVNAEDSNEAPVAVAVAPEPEVAAPPIVIDHSKGKEIYQKACSSCHDTGIDNAPGMDDTVAWVQLMAAGNEALYASTINGKGAMPPKGGQKNLSEADIREAVDYIIDKVISAR